METKHYQQSALDADKRALKEAEAKKQAEPQGTEGQDRENYTDTQDREFYTPK